MLRKMLRVLPAFLILAALSPAGSIAQQGALAAITNVTYVAQSGGLTFYVDFRISNHAAETGKVRLTLTEGVDTLVVEREFRPDSSAAVFAGFGVHVPYQRLISEGRFRREEVHATVEILSMGGRVLARESGLFIMPRMRPRQVGPRNVDPLSG